MARLRLWDHLQSFRFWLFDVPTDWTGLLDLFVLLPVFGFSQITSPEISLEVETIRAGNRIYPYKAAPYASLNTITLSRGAFWGDSDFYRWTMKYLQGKTGSRRTLLLIHFTNYNIAAMTGGEAQISFGPITLAPFVPAKAWLLEGCIPARCKVASDFDASSGDVSLVELDVEYEDLTEVALMA